MKYKYLTREYETITDVKKHFRELSKKYHPDMGARILNLENYIVNTSIL